MGLTRIRFKKGKKKEKRESGNKRYLDVGFIKEIGVVVNNLEHIHFVENDHSCSLNHRKRLDDALYMSTDSLLSYIGNSVTIYIPNNEWAMPMDKIPITDNLWKSIM